MEVVGEVCFGSTGFAVKRSGFGVRACVRTLAPQIRVSTTEIPEEPVFFFAVLIWLWGKIP